MNWQKFIASDAIVYGLKETINNVRIALYSMFIFLSEILVSILVIGLPFITFVIWQVPELRVVATDMRNSLMSGAFATTYVTFQEITFSQLPLSIIITGALALYMLITLWFMFGAGYVRMVIKFHDSGTADLREMFMGWHRGLRLCIASFLYMLAVVVGLCLCIVPGIYVLVHGILYPFFIVDKNVGALEALKKSFVAVKGSAWQVGSIVLVLSLFNLSPIISMLACFTKLLMLTHVYRRLTA
jgi:uncharacterized membrane protein